MTPERAARAAAHVPGSLALDRAHRVQGYGVLFLVSSCVALANAPLSSRGRAISLVGQAVVAPLIAVGMLFTRHPATRAAAMGFLVAIAGEHFMRDLLRGHGLTCHAGSLTVLGPHGFPGAPQATGIAWMRAEDLSGVERGMGSRLAGVLLMGGETAVAQRCGVTRVLAHLGQATRYYPAPPWSDRRRREVLAAAANEASLLARVPTLFVPGVHVRMDGAETVHLRILEGSREKVASALEQAPPLTPFALLMEVDPEATSCLLWAPGQREACGISSPSYDPARPKLAGSFLLVVPGVEEEETKPFEDGFTLTITAETWTELRRCLVEGEPFERSFGNNMRFELSWIMQTFVNPIDGTTMFCEGGWTTAPPDTGGRPWSLLLLTGLDDLQKLIELPALTTYVGEVAELANEWPRTPGEELRVQIDLTPHEPAFVRARLGALTEELPPLQEGCRSVARLAAPVVKGLFSFQLIWS